MTTSVRAWSRGSPASRVSAVSASVRADARGWRTFVPSEPRPHGRGHEERSISLTDFETLKLRSPRRSWDLGQLVAKVPSSHGHLAHPGRPASLENWSRIRPGTNPTWGHDAGANRRHGSPYHINGMDSQDPGSVGASMTRVPSRPGDRASTGSKLSRRSDTLVSTLSRDRGPDSAARPIQLLSIDRPGTKVQKDSRSWRRLGVSPALGVFSITKTWRIGVLGPGLLTDPSGP